MRVLVKHGKLLTLRFQIIGLQNRSTCDSRTKPHVKGNSSCFRHFNGSAGTDHYHLIVDNELPGLSGLELILSARSLSHRRKTPIIMLSSDDCEKEAWRAGVDAFLRKPKGVDKVASTINRLLTSRETKR